MKSRLLFLGLTLLFTIPVVFSIFYHPFFTFHDETQIVNLHQFFKTIDLGQFPPRWGLDFHFNYGSPFPQFYYQTPYYIGYLYHLLGFSLVETFQQLLVLSFFLGALGMYFLGLQITTPLWAFVVSVIYSFTPYRAVASYVRGSLGESLALGLFPWVFLFSLRLFQKPNLKRAILAGLFWALLILTHQLATIFFLPFVFFCGLLLCFKNRKLLPFLLISFLFCLGLSAYYLLPTLLEQKFIQGGSPFNFYDHFPFLRQFISSPWGYRASIWGPDDGLSFQLGVIPLALLLLCLLSLPFLLRSKTETIKKRIFLYLLASFFAVIFLMNIRSSFFWQIFPLTQLVQFPWRLLLLTTFLVPTIFLFLTPLFPRRLSPLLALLILAAVSFTTVSYFQTGEIYDRDDDYYLHRFLPNQASYDQDSISSEYLLHTEDYVSLPLTAHRPDSLPPAKLTATNSATQIETVSDHPFNLSYKISTNNYETYTFHTFDFPGWTVKVDDQKIAHTQNEIGAITFSIPAGNHLLSIAYINTLPRRLGNAISLITLGIALLLLFSGKLDKKWL